MSNPSQLITTQAAADLLCLQRNTLEKWRQQGTGPKFVKVSRSTIRYRLTDVEQFIVEQSAEAPLVEA